MEGNGQELAPGLHRIEAPLGDRFVACFLVVGAEAALLFDTGIDETPAATILPYCRSAGVAPEMVRWIVASHCDVDHVGGDAAAKALFPAASLLAHADDRALIEDVERIIEDRYREFRDGHGIDIDEGMIAWCRDVTRTAPVDVVIDGPTKLDLGGRTVEIVPTPGHSAGSVSLWDPTSRAAITGDAVLGDSLHYSDGRPAFPPTYRAPTPYRETVARIEALQPEWLLTSHEPAMDAATGRAFLVQSRDFADRLEALTRSALATATSPRSTLELIDELAPQMGSWDPGVWVFLANELVGHLEDLEASGDVLREPGQPQGWLATRRSTR